MKLAGYRDSIIRRRRIEGFTLIETIVVLVMVGFLAAFMAQFVHVSFDEGAVTVGHYQNEGNLQGMMEDVTGKYRDMLTNGTLSLGTLKSYAEAECSGAVAAAETGYVTFSPSGGNNYQASAVSQTPGANSVLIITLSLGDQRVTSLFTE
jgi:prepilin-type N-terminal cleavage/methylation domain-containing protein